MTTVSPQSYQHLTLEVAERLALITMSRPARRNALSLEHMEELIDAFRSVGRRGDVGAVVLRGAGPAFCAGHDLSEMTGRSPEFYRHLFDTCTVLMETIQAIPHPVIAQVHGMATAAGCQLAATCDLVIAAENARFATPGVRIGLFCSTPMVALSRAIPPKKAMEMLLTGDPITAEEARAYGLVNRVVPEADLEETTQAIAAQIAASSSAWWVWASRPSTARSICRSTRPTPTPKKSCLSTPPSPMPRRVSAPSSRSARRAGAIGRTPPDQI